MRGRVLLLVTSSIAGLLVIGSSLFLLINSSARLPNSVLGGLRVTTPPLDNKDHLYVLDGWGGVHPLGNSPALSTSAAWPTKDIAFSLALFPDGTGGYVMDGWGQLHPVGSAPSLDSHVYWPNWIGAREIVMAPWSSSSRPAGYLLDADGGIHPFGGAPAVTGNALWLSQGIARGLVVTPGSTPGSVAGYTLDGFGGVHPFGGARPVVGAARWPDDVARGIVLVKGSNGLFVDGYTLDYSGGIHPFGGAPSVTPSATWPNQDMADSIVSWTAAPSGDPGGWVLDRHGDVHPWGSAPPIAPSQTWPGWDIARGLAGAGSGGGSTERTILDAQPLSNGWGSYFNQRDARWASADVGAAAHPVWQIGCLISDLAMVYSHFGFRSVTPATIAAHTEWFNAGGAIFNSALHVPGHTTSIVAKPDAAWIRAQVAAGHPVVVGMDLPSGTTHFVTLTGLDGDSDFWVNDPWEQNAMHVTFSGDWFTRGPIYEAIVFF
jgi:peptidase C39-like protein